MADGVNAVSSNLSAISTLLALPQADDAGAQTADRYEWQAAMAAADSFAVYLQWHNGDFAGLNPDEINIICELHEDWIVQLGSEAELVSAKHRDPSSGPWKDVATLVSDGGVGHLFVRWLAADRKPTARLVTNAATAPGPARRLADCSNLPSQISQSGRIADDLNGELDTIIDAFCRGIMMYRKNVPDSWRAPAEARSKDLTVPDDLIDAGHAFLRILRIDEGRPSRSYVAHAASSMYAQPVASRLGHASATAQAMWEVVLQVLRIRMRARGDTIQGGLPTIGRNGLTQGAVESVESRTVSLGDIEVAIATAVRHPNAYIPVAIPSRPTKLSAKMAQGRCSHTSIERAEQLRLDYSDYRRELRNAVPGSVGEIKKIERVLHRIADEETQRVRNPSGSWGAELWSALSHRLKNQNELTNFDLDEDLSLGGVCYLSSQCKVWFSEGFDVKGFISDMKTQGGGQNGATTSGRPS
ncbi:hypothetical protein J1902_07385 [Arthrobacter sp. PO-11]|uniref:DUF4297 domain-containing protein n=2 Tax=Arthrobacter cavernae TaxID=2817681 RepID=A0A939HH68_9MICC|nr:hypothetical protein [Arthrobacter cavernae]